MKPKDSPSKKKDALPKKSNFNAWYTIAIGMLMIFVPWAFYVNYHPRFSATSSEEATKNSNGISPITTKDTIFDRLSHSFDFINKGAIQNLEQDINKDTAPSEDFMSKEATRSVDFMNAASKTLIEATRSVDFMSTASNKLISEPLAKTGLDKVSPSKEVVKAKNDKKATTTNTDDYSDASLPKMSDKDMTLEERVNSLLITNQNKAQKQPVPQHQNENQKPKQKPKPKPGKREEDKMKPFSTLPDPTDKEDQAKKKKPKNKGPADPVDEIALKKLLSQKPVHEGNKIKPVLGEIPEKGTMPLYGMKHSGGDAIMALACNYPKNYYQRFVGSLRKAKYEGDIVLAVSPPAKMKPGVEDYIKKMKVVAYGFDVECAGTDNCKLMDDFLGYPDPRPHRTFANIRYALYEYWLRHYDERSYILILDFRDTFFQVNPFAVFGPVATRPLQTYNLQLYAENSKVKSIGKCVYNSLWIGRCFGKPALKDLSSYPVICSGSTLGSYLAIVHYVRTMLMSMDSVKCWLRGIESDQGYQNFLFYHGYFTSPDGLTNATLFQQGEGVVNTIGAMNGFRVPKHMKGPLDTFWKIRDNEGRILNNDGSISACVHQWDRWYSELVHYIDHKTY